MTEYTVKVTNNGDKVWYIHGKLHREDGPAVELANGGKFWYRNGKLHREDGPAVEYANGGKVWYLNGKKVSEKDFNKAAAPCDGREITIDGVTYTLKAK